MDLSPAIITQALAIATLVKGAVDLFKMARPQSQSWQFVAVGTVAGWVFALAMFMLSPDPFTRQSVAAMFLTGFLGTAGAMGVSQMGSKADELRSVATQTVPTGGTATLTPSEIKQTVPAGTPDAFTGLSKPLTGAINATNPPTPQPPRTGLNLR